MAQTAAGSCNNVGMKLNKDVIINSRESLGFAEYREIII